MNTQLITIIIAAAVVAVLVIAGVLIWVFSRRRRLAKLRDQFGPEYDHTVRSMGDERKAVAELEERQKRVEALEIQPLSIVQRDRFVSQWRAIQTNFVDDPRQAIVDADKLIQEVMQLRAYPVTDFEQMAADLSVHYPQVVSNYRRAHEIAEKSAQGQADTEEMRQAMVYYRSLFEDLVEAEGEEEKPALQEAGK
jgi:flagellar basal body-associated protein FliL